MPRSSFSDNPLLRVSRPVSACSRCRAAKVKCDGKLPACTACEKAGRENECSAANDQFARGKERSYVAALELRVEKLERRLKFAKSRKASMALHDTDALPSAAVDRKDSLATIQAAIYRKAARRRENSDVNTLVSDFGFLSVNATTRDFEPAVSNMTFARLVLAAATNDPLPESERAEPPSRETAHALVQYYVDNLYAIYPFFNVATLHSVLETLYQEGGGRSMVRPSDCWLLYMALAIGSTAQSRSRQDERYRDGVEYVAQAMRYAERALMPGHESQIRSLILLTQYSMFDPAHFDSWHLIGFTCRAIVDLGLHQDPPESQPIDKERLDVRRKVFYCAYALDRSISMVHARAFSFTDESVSVCLPSMSGMGRIPSVSGTITGPQSSDPAILLFQFRQTQSHWYQTLFQSDPSDPLTDAPSYIWQMCHEMREWAESLPDTLPVGVRKMFDLELKYSYVYCIAPSGRAPIITAYGRFLIFEYAIAYVDAFFELAHGPPSALITYHHALRVYFMGSQFVAVMRDTGDALLAAGSTTSIPVPLATPGTAPPPPMPERRGAGDNLDRSLVCLERVSATLRTLGDRWDDANALRSSFDSLSADTLEMLRKRKAMRDAAASQAQAQARAQMQAQQASPGSGPGPSPGPPPQMHMSPPPPSQAQAQALQFHQRSPPQQQQQHHPPPPGPSGPPGGMPLMQPPQPGQGLVNGLGGLPGGPMHHHQQHPHHQMQQMQQMQQLLPHQMQQQQQQQQTSPPPHPAQAPPAQAPIQWVDVDIEQMVRQGGI